MHYICLLNNLIIITLLAMNQFSKFLILLSLILIGNISFAQDFEVAPVKLDFHVEPGDNQTKTINVKNHGNQKVTYMVVLADFIPPAMGSGRLCPPKALLVVQQPTG